MGSNSEGKGLPDLRIPLLYFLFATICFVLAMLGTVTHSQDLIGFYYHPRILALTHLITLGWISGHIIGSLYILSRMTLRMEIRTGSLDLILFSVFVIGVSGMVSHFWINRMVGMAWSAGCVYISLILIAVKFISALRAANIGGFIKLHILFAFANVLLAGGWGMLAAINKIHGFLPTSSGPTVIAHAHLAAVGWGLMMVFGIAYRLLPMFLPGKPVRSKLPWISGITLQMGALTLFGSILAQTQWAVTFSAVLIFVGVGLFFRSAIHTYLLRKPEPPPALPRPDFSLLHIPAAFCWLLVALVVAIVLLYSTATEQTLRISLAYGFVVLFGFFGHMIVGMKPKILSIFSWYHAFDRKGNLDAIPRPVDMPIRVLQLAVFLFWILGIGMFVAGITIPYELLITFGGVLLLCGLLLSTVNEIWILKHIWRS